MTDNKKSKVTSIRVEPELYDSFKQTVESQDKQVTAVLSTMMKQYVQTTKREQMQAMLENIMSIQPVAEQFYTSLGLASGPTALGLELFTSQFNSALKHLNKYMATVCDITSTELTYDCVSIPQTNLGEYAFCLTCVVDGSEPRVAGQILFGIHSVCKVGAV